MCKSLRVDETRGYAVHTCAIARNIFLFGLPADRVHETATATKGHFKSCLEVRTAGQCEWAVGEGESGVGEWGVGQRGVGSGSVDKWNRGRGTQRALRRREGGGCARERALVGARLGGTCIDEGAICEFKARYVFMIGVGRPSGVAGRVMRARGGRKQ